MSPCNVSGGKEGPLRVTAFGVSPKGLPFSFSEQLQTDTTKHFQTPVRFAL